MLRRPCESKLPPRGACVTLVLNQSRLHTTRKKIKNKGIEKPAEPGTAPTRRGTTATSLTAFHTRLQHRRVPCRVLADQAPLPPHCIPGKIPGVQCGGEGGEKIRHTNNTEQPLQACRLPRVCTTQCAYWLTKPYSPLPPSSVSTFGNQTIPCGL